MTAGFLNAWANLRQRAAAFLGGECVLCRAHAADGAVCAACAAALPGAGPACPQCAAPSSSGAVCGRCLSHPPRFDAVSAAVTYAYPADALVQAFKYGGNHAAGRFLGRALAAKTHERPDLVVPIPLATGRLAERGFNQSLELAMVVADRCGLVLESRALQRCRATRPQVGLSRELRLDNVRGAFMADSGRVVGRHVVLVDDVVTTGSTVAAAAQGLRHAGARRVDVWCIARAPG